MKTFKILAVACLLLLLPLTTYAFSWRSLAFWQKDKVTETINENTKKLDFNSEKQAQEKLVTWTKSFEQKKWTELKKDPQNFQISEAEVNFLLKEALNKNTEVPATNVYLKFLDNKITITGQLLKPVSGKFETTVRIDSSGKSITPIVEKMKFKGIPMPKSIANKVIQQYFPKASEFLYTYPDYKTLTVEINNGLLKLVYSK